MGGSSSSKQTVGYKYSIGMHMILHHGPVDKITRIEVGGREAWSGENTGGPILIDKPELFGGESREGGVSGTVDIDMGGPTQGQNAYLVGRLGSLVPAFRGVVSAVLNQVYIGLNPYLKNWKFRSQRIHVRQDGIEQWYNAKAEIGFSSGGNLEYLYDYSVIQDYSSTGDYVTYADEEGFQIGRANQGRFEGGLYYGSATFWNYDSSGVLQSTYTIEHPITASGTSFDFHKTAIIQGKKDSFAVYCTTGPVKIYPHTTEIIPIEFGNTISPLNHTYSDGFYYLTISTPYGEDKLQTDGDTIVRALSIPGVIDTPVFIWQDALTGRKFVYWMRESDSAAILGEYTGDDPSDMKWTHVFGAGLTENGGYPISIFGDYLVRVTGMEGGMLRLYKIEANGVSEELASAASGPISRVHYIGNWRILSAPKVYRFGYMGHSDLNPAHIIRECLTDPDWGMGYPESDIDDASFMAAADRLYEEQMGISILWDKSTTIEQFIGIIAAHIDAQLYVSRKTGKFTIKLMRDDYDAGSLLVLGEDEILKVEDYARPAFSDLTNTVTVQYWDAASGENASVTVSDPALVQMQGTTIAQTRDYTGFTNAKLAARAAQRDLKALSLPLLSCTIYANRKASSLDIGSVFKFKWPDLHDGEIIMRVVGMALGDGRKNVIRLSCVEDVFAIPDSPIAAAQESEFVDELVDPVAATYQIAQEAPYYEVAQFNGDRWAQEELAYNEAAGWLLVAAARPAAEINARVYVDSGAGYTDAAALDFCPAATLTAAIGKTDTVVAIGNGVDLDNVRVGSLACIGGEIVRVDTISETSMTVGRGCLDTVPIEHVSGEHVIFWDDFVASDMVQYNAGETVNAKILPSTGLGTLAESAATALPVTFNYRAVRPYPPGNWKINGVYYPDTVASGDYLITWAHRDRLQQTSGTIIDFTDGDVGPEAGQTYNVLVTDVVFNETVYSATGITGTSNTATPLTSGQHLVETWSTRGTFDSANRHSTTILYGPLLLTEEGGPLLEEDNTYLEQEE